MMASLPLQAQSDSVSYVLGIGSANILDTYISPEKYKGSEIRYGSTRIHHYKQTAWQWRLMYMGNVSFTENRAENVDEIGGEVVVQYAWQRNWSFNKVTLSVGPTIEGKLGFLYNTRNQNNPAQAEMAINIGPSFSATIPLCKVFNHPLTLSYDGSMPFFGLMFSPNYGQSYYEIFSKDDYDRNVVPTTFFSTPSYRHSVNFSIGLKKSNIIVGYMGDYQQAKVNNLKYNHFSHLFVIGYSKPF